MKNISFFFLTILFPFLGFSQAMVTVSGTADPASGENIKAVVDPYFCGLKTKIYEDKVKNGQFKLSFSLDKNCFIDLQQGAKTWTLYLDPGDEIAVDLSGAKPLFSGKNAANNQLWIDFCEKCGNKSRRDR